MKKRIAVSFMSMLLLTGVFAGCEKNADAGALHNAPAEIDQPDTGEMGQYEGDAALMSESEAMVLFEEIYEINKYLESGMTMRFDGSTVEIDGQTCICATLGTEENGEFTVEGHYAATMGSAYLLDPITGDWTPVGFG